MFSKKSISFGSWSTNELSKKNELGFELSAPNYPRQTCFQKPGFLLVLSGPMRFQGNPTSVSNSWTPISPEKKFRFWRGRPPIHSPPDVLAPVIVVSTTYYDLQKKKKILIFRGGDPP
jgi:hypothetical protein